MKVSTLDVAVGVISDLDRNDAAAVGAWFASGATWWVDTGLDSLSGRFGIDPGDDRPWPLHGSTDAAEKAAMLADLPTRFPGGCRQTIMRSFAGGRIGVVEVAGEGLYRGKRRYANRYAFMIEVTDGKVVSLHEYLDTAHAADVFDGRNLDRRTTSPPSQPVPIDAKTTVGAIALDFVDSLDRGDGARIERLCGPDAAWWADGGRTRTAGPEAPPELAPKNPAKGNVVIAVRAPLVNQLGGLFPNGLRMVPHRLVEADGAGSSGLTAIEVEGLGQHSNGMTYQNRYCFVIQVLDGSIATIREYCDTLHGFDVLRGGR